MYIPLPALLSFFSGSGTDSYLPLLLNLRLARVLTAFLAGGILSFSGVLYQTVFQNPLVDAYMLGVASGATLGGILFLRLGYLYPWPGAFLCALIATFLTLYLGKHNSGVSLIKTLLGGIVVGSFMAATTTFLFLTWKGPFHGGLFWALGSFSNSSLRDALVLFIAGSIYLFLFLLLHRSLDVLLLGEEEALSLGLKVGKFRLFLLIASALSVSLVSSKFGIIGFVGLIAPHMSRFISGSLHNTLLPVAFLLGGSLLVVSDTFARTAFAPVEIPVGVITVMLGGPFFLYLLRRRV